MQQVSHTLNFISLRALKLHRPPAAPYSLCLYYRTRYCCQLHKQLLLNTIKCI
jgi:hypothetical protein